MRVLNCFIAATTLPLLGARGHAIPEGNFEPEVAVDSIIGRALPNSPDGYTPTEVDCPSSRPSVRPASSLSQHETSWLELRRNNTITPMRELLARLNITGFDADSYMSQYSTNVSALPNIGLAMSGGGWRAMLTGAGVIAAFDNRTPGSVTAGHLGGLLQSSTYLTGLSGGSWLVGSLFANNFSSITALLNSDSKSLWKFGNPIIEGPDTGSSQLLSTADYYKTIVDEVKGKKDAGFNLTLTDIWGRELSFQLINDTDGGPAYTFSSIALSENFQNGDTPFPILIAEERAPGVTLIPINTTIFEFNPYETGTWDSSTYGFVPTKYLGSNFTAGIVPADEKCIVGFDNFGFTIGTSSTLFNELVLSLNTTSLPSIVKSVLNSILSDIDIDSLDSTDYPNPLYRYNLATNPSANSSRLTLVDGGEDLETIPFYPLVQPLRNVDVIFAVDAGWDTTNNWPNGTSLVRTYERSLAFIANGTAFPSVPDTNTFVNLGLNKRPTFFGCDARNFSSTHPPPLVVWLPNSPYTYYSNVSTFQLAYNDSVRDSLVLNGYNIATMANGTLNSSWPMCVGCAILSRSFDRTGTTTPEACTKCFSDFCWDGTINSTTPTPYMPTIMIETTQKSAGAIFRKRITSFGAAIGVATAFALFV